MSRRARLLLGAVGWIAVAALALALARARRSGETDAIPVLTRLPDFELVDQRGHPFGSARLHGKAWIAGFAFTSCTSVCPMLTAQMANLARRLAPHGDRVHLVTITVDPETDTPERLRAYAERHGADPERWSFLTGAPEQVRTTITRGFFVPIGERRPVPGGYDILHTGQLMLVDPHMRLRGLYATDAAGLGALERDVARLLEGSGYDVQ